MATKIVKRARTTRRDMNAPYPMPMSSHPTGTWAADEHDRFLEAMKLYPKGPWKAIADHVATRSVRQVQTHAQKYQEKVVRRMRGLRKPKRNGDESDEEIGHRVVMGTYGKLRKRKGDDSEEASAMPSGTESQTDKESVCDDSDADSVFSNSPRHEMERSVSKPSSPKNTPKHDSIKPKPTLEEQSPVGPDCIDLTPLRLAELSPGWFYLDELSDKAMDAVDTESTTECSMGLPSLGESLDFFIEYLSIVT